MAYIKRVMVGFAVALLAAVLWVFGNLEFPLYWAELSCRLRACEPHMWALASTVLVPLPVLLAGLALGFFWTIRRHRRRSAAAN